MTDEEKALFAGLYESLRATNALLKATIEEVGSLKMRVNELDHCEYLHDERITLLEAARFRGEHPFLPAKEKMN